LAKNTTDMALAVDAMDLCARYAPGVLAIGTGDADFAPLVLRLRERGVRTVCFSQANKMSPEVHGFYDEVVLLGARRSAAASVVAVAAPVPAPAPQPAPAPASAPARKTAARKTPARKTAAKAVVEAASAPAPAPAPVAPPPPEPVPAPAPVSARAAAAAAREAELSERVQSLLRELPGVAEGQEVDFGEVAKRLRESKLLGRQAVMSKFLKKHVPGVELTPQAQPRKLRWAPGTA
jgi:hypothetical protein